MNEILDSYDLTKTKTVDFFPFAALVMAGRDALSGHKQLESELVRYKGVSE